MRRHVLLLGVGNEDRRDDGIGPALVRALGDRLPAGVDGAIEPGDFTRIMARWEGHDAVLLVDAAAAQAKPGTVTVLEHGHDPLPAPAPDPSSHGFGVAEAIRLSDALGTLPETLVLISVAGADFGHGRGLSPALSAAFDALADRVLAELEALVASTRREAADA